VKEINLKILMEKYILICSFVLVQFSSFLMFDIMTVHILHLFLADMTFVNF
jgi:hypothetical protein